MITTAAVLARGLGARMRRADREVALDAAQSASADAGLKGMIPIDRPFLDYVITALADAGITTVVLVIGPDHAAMRTYYTETSPPTRVQLLFAVQEQPLGTADAVVAAADVIGETPFLVLNADNHYPADVVRALAADESAGVVAFDRAALLADALIEPERLRVFAVLDIDANDALRAIVEKPGDALDPSSEAARWVSMNLWAITPALVRACRLVPRSARGEFELPEAVAFAVTAHGARVRVVRAYSTVLDLSSRGDVPKVSARLRGTRVHT